MDHVNFNQLILKLVIEKWTNYEPNKTNIPHTINVTTQTS